MSLVRRMTELAVRDRSFVRRTPVAFGRRPLVVSPDASLRWMRRDPWRDEAELILALELLATPGTVTWDFGANVGAFGLCAAARTRAPLLLIEADVFLASLLRQTARRNPDLSMDVLCCAVGHSDGVARFAIAGRGRNANGLVDGAISTQHGVSREIQLVPQLCADTLLDHFAPPALVKVDLEGAEAFFMQGSRRLLELVRPTFYIEIHRDNRPAVFADFAASGYEVRQNLGQGWLPVTDDPPSENFFAAPAERAAALFG